MHAAPTAPISSCILPKAGDIATADMFVWIVLLDLAEKESKGILLLLGRVCFYFCFTVNS